MTLTMIFSSMNFPLHITVFLSLFFFMIFSIFKLINNTLMVFIFLEMMVLLNFYILSFVISFEIWSLSFTMVFFTLAVCEASLALSTLVKLMRNISSVNLPLLSHISLNKTINLQS